MIENKFTDKEFKKIFKDAEVTFSSYYKYVFCFTGEFNGYKIQTRYGGSSDDIYRYGVDTAPISLVKTSWDYIVITKDEKIIYEKDTFW